MRRTIYVLVVLVASLSATSSLETQEEEDEFHKYINHDVDPCDDFYEYTCGNFNKVHPLTQDTITIDQFTLLQDKILDITRKILSSEDESEDPRALRVARGVYQACMDTDYMDMFKDPERQIVDQFQGYPLVEPPYMQRAHRFGWNDVADAVSQYGVQMLLKITISPSYLNASKNLIMIDFDSGAWPELSLNPEVDDDHETLMEKALSEMAQKPRLKSKKGLGQTPVKPFDVFLKKLALKIKKAMYVRTSDYQINKNIDEMANFMRGVFLKGYIPPDVDVDGFDTGVEITLDQLNAWTQKQFGDNSGIEWVEYMRRIFRYSGIEIDGSTSVMSTTSLPPLLYGMINLVRITNDDVVKSFVMTRIFLYNALDSDRESRQMLEEYYTKKSVKIPPRWEYCVKKVTDLRATETMIGLSFAVTYEYQLHHFNVNRLSKAVQMVKDLRESFRGLIEESTWMDSSCKQKALLKLEKMVTILGYPEMAANKTEVENFYENIKVCKWNNYENTLNLRAFKLAYHYSQVLERSRSAWTSSPFRINAFYNRPNNKITFPVAILNPIFFGSRSSVLDYGRIGSIIGHEITHGFDQVGSFYDESGQYTMGFWSNETRTAFNTRTDCFVQQYKQYYMPEIGSYVNATSTLNENIADNGGLRESYRAMKRLLNRQNLPKNYKNPYNYTDEQLFFIGFGSMWCNNPSKAYLLNQKDQEHAPSKWRVNGVLSNAEEFAAAFQCPKGSRMNPTKKCILF